MKNGTGGEYYRAVARGYNVDLQARTTAGEATWRHVVMSLFFDVIATPESDVDGLDGKLLVLRETLEDWHRAVLLGDTE
jgi:hypothetical protein